MRNLPLLGLFLLFLAVSAQSYVITLPSYGGCGNMDLSGYYHDDENIANQNAWQGAVPDVIIERT